MLHIFKVSVIYLSCIRLGWKWIPLTESGGESVMRDFGDVMVPMGKSSVISPENGIMTIYVDTEGVTLFLFLICSIHLCS